MAMVLGSQCSASGIPDRRLVQIVHQILLLGKEFRWLSGKLSKFELKLAKCVTKVSLT